MNKKGQLNPIAFIIGLFVFILFWIFFIADFLNMAGASFLANNDATGLETFFYSNLNLFIMIGLVLSVLMYGVLNQ